MGLLGKMRPERAGIGIVADSRLTPLRQDGSEDYVPGRRGVLFHGISLDTLSFQAKDIGIRGLGMREDESADRCVRNHCERLSEA